MIANDSICYTIFDNVVRNVGFGAIHKATNHVSSTVQFSNGVQLILIQEALDQYAVNLFANPPVLAVDDVFDLSAIGQAYGEQVAKHIKVV